MPNSVDFYGLRVAVGVAPAVVIVGRPGTRLMAGVASAAVWHVWVPGWHLRRVGQWWLGGFDGG